MRIVLGVTGASGAIYAVEFLRQTTDQDVFTVVSRWGRSVLHQETGLSVENLAAFSKKLFSNEDLNAPLASGSNDFHALRHGGLEGTAEDHPLRARDAVVRHRP
jgi:flavin prenyltransferase